jgi:uncharacterized RDD family membrane protein YckC
MSERHTSNEGAVVDAAVGGEPAAGAGPPVIVASGGAHPWTRFWQRVRSPDRTYHAGETARMQALEGLELASFSRRAAAILIDFVLAAALFVVLVGPAGTLWERLHPGTHLRIVLAFGGGKSNWYSIIFLTAYFSLAVFLTNGRPPGKRLCGIRIVSTAHARISLWHAFERALGYAVSAGELGLGFLQYFTASNCRTTHDRIADTIVVRSPGTKSSSADDQ